MRSGLWLVSLALLVILGGFGLERALGSDSPSARFVSHEAQGGAQSDSDAPGEVPRAHTSAFSDTARTQLSAPRSTPPATPTPDGPLPHGAPCDSTQRAAAAVARARIQSTFTRAPLDSGRATVYADPSVPSWIAELTSRAIPLAARAVSTRLGLNSAAPDVYLYRDAEQLREGVCVSPSTVAYYDGAIHVAPSSRGWETSSWQAVVKSLRHELVHHVFFSHGIRRPVWFQEGVAMLVENPRDGDSEWAKWLPTARLLRTDQMVQTFPQAVSAAEAEAFYGQAFAMTVFLEKLCKNRESCDVAELVHALESGATAPDTLFDWAVSRRGSDLARTARLPLWDDYVENGLRFAPATKLAISQRRD
jgi:hypothetical protein